MLKKLDVKKHYLLIASFILTLFVLIFLATPILVLSITVDDITAYEDTTGYIFIQQMDEKTEYFDRDTSEYRYDLTQKESYKLEIKYLKEAIKDIEDPEYKNTLTKEMQFYKHNLTLYNALVTLLVFNVFTFIFNIIVLLAYKGGLLKEESKTIQIINYVNIAFIFIIFVTSCISIAEVNSSIDYYKLVLGSTKVGFSQTAGPCILTFSLIFLCLAGFSNVWNKVMNTKPKTYSETVEETIEYNEKSPHIIDESSESAEETIHLDNPDSIENNDIDPDSKD